MEIIENNNDGTSSVVYILFDEEGDEVYRCVKDMYDNETGTSLIFNKETNRWEYPEGFFKHFDEEEQMEIE